MDSTKASTSRGAGSRAFLQSIMTYVSSVMINTSKGVRHVKNLSYFN